MNQSLLDGLTGIADGSASLFIGEEINVAQAEVLLSAMADDGFNQGHPLITYKISDEVIEIAFANTSTIAQASDVVSTGDLSALSPEDQQLVAYRTTSDADDGVLISGGSVTPPANTPPTVTAALTDTVTEDGAVSTVVY